MEKVVQRSGLLTRDRGHVIGHLFLGTMVDRHHQVDQKTGFPARHAGQERHDQTCSKRGRAGVSDIDPKQRRQLVGDILHAMGGGTGQRVGLASMTRNRKAARGNGRDVT